MEVISHCVWLYHRFPLSFREVEGLMLQRGVIASYETVRRWRAKFDQAFANGLRRHRPRPGDKWHLNEVFVRTNGELKYLWRAADQDGNVLDTLLRPRRDAKATRCFFRRLMKKARAVPRVIVTDKLRSYGAAHRKAMPSVEHLSHKGLNNRAEDSHQLTWQRDPSPGGPPTGSPRCRPKPCTASVPARRTPSANTASTPPDFSPPYPRPPSSA
ncbi:IS6 family transposase [Streptomyces sp. NPDC057238]|uniref:IS6 family transposase n=1 Tax=Streptomyces sp. NPDC057238 TaxID=3346060 RepID=UPI000AB4B1F1